MNIEQLSSNLGLEKEDYLELVELLIASGEEDINRLKEAVAINDPDGAAKAAHSLKGAAANLGLTDLSEIARQAEMQAREGVLAGVEEKIEALQTKLNEVAAIAS